MIRLLKVLSLFFVVGLVSGLLTVALSHVTNYVVWTGAGVIFLAGLAASLMVAHQQEWLSLNASASQYVKAALLICVAYPTTFLAMLGGWFFHSWLYSVLYPVHWRERTYSGNFDTGSFNIGLILAAVAGAVLVSLALRLVTRTWDKQILALLVLAGIAAISLSFAIASLVSEQNWYLILYPVGESLFSALCGYSLLKSGSNIYETPKRSSESQQR